MKHSLKTYFHGIMMMESLLPMEEIFEILEKMVSTSQNEGFGEK